MTLIFLACITLSIGAMYASIFEWTLHRFVMHRPFGPITYPHFKHAIVHHRVFRADASYHLKNKEDENIIHMAGWGAVITIIGSLPFCVVALVLWLTELSNEAWVIFSCGVFISVSFYGIYEFLHWCMHHPKGRWFEKTWWFKAVNGHHILHHRFTDHNFNTVLPVADWLFGTLLLRSKISFKQVRGPSVPDVQPIT